MCRYILVGDVVPTAVVSYYSLCTSDIVQLVEAARTVSLGSFLKRSSFKTEGPTRCLHVLAVEPRRVARDAAFHGARRALGCPLKPEPRYSLLMLPR